MLITAGDNRPISLLAGPTPTFSGPFVWWTMSSNTEALIVWNTNLFFCLFSWRASKASTRKWGRPRPMALECWPKTEDLLLPNHFLVREYSVITNIAVYNFVCLRIGTPFGSCDRKSWFSIGAEPDGHRKRHLSDHQNYSVQRFSSIAKEVGLILQLMSIDDRLMSTHFCRFGWLGCPFGRTTKRFLKSTAFSIVCSNGNAFQQLIAMIDNDK